MIKGKIIVCDICKTTVNTEEHEEHGFKTILYPVTTKDLCPNCYERRFKLAIKINPMETIENKVKKLIKEYNQIIESLVQGELIPKWKLLKLSKIESKLESKGFNINERV